MSLITCCPACGTMFKVVPDQLRISEGWVRCGHCDNVFDANANLQPRTSAVPQTSQIQPHTPHTPPASHTPPAPAPLVAPPPPSTVAAAPPGRAPAPATAIAAFATDDPNESISSEVRPSQLETGWPPYGDLADEAAAQASEETQPAVLDDLSFVRQARRRAFWRSRSMRATLGALALLSVCALGLQWAVHDRDRLAFLQPELKPALQWLCQPIGCSVSPPRQIDAIVIDSSTFNNLRGDAYRLSLTLKNQSGLALALPAIELTLTDSQDQAVVRRVLTATELGATSATVAGGSEWSGALALTVAAGGAGRISGYRLLAFYP